MKQPCLDQRDHGKDCDIRRKNGAAPIRALSKQYSDCGRVGFGKCADAGP